MVAAYSYLISNELNISNFLTASRIIDPDDNHGNYRRVEVTFSHANSNPAAKAREIPVLMTRWFGTLTGMPMILPTAMATHIHDELMWIHPLKDGNGRIGKIVFNKLQGTLDSPKFPNGKYL